MRENREQAIRLIGLSEGGYVNDPADPGGETNFGITAKTFAAWNIRTGRAQRSVRELTKAEAEEIIGAQYLDPIQFDALPAGIDYLVADYAVNSGPARAARDIQALVGVAPDGIIGLQTIAAIRAADQVQLINAYCDRRMQFLRGLKTWKRYGKGWSARVTGARAQALIMAGGTAQPTAILPSPRAREEDVSSGPMVARITAQGGAAAAAVGAMSAALKDLPEQATLIVVGAAALAGLLAATALIYRWVRA